MPTEGVEISTCPGYYKDQEGDIRDVREKGDIVFLLTQHKRRLFVSCPFISRTSPTQNQGTCLASPKDDNRAMDAQKIPCPYDYIVLES